MNPRRRIVSAALAGGAIAGGAFARTGVASAALWQALVGGGSHGEASRLGDGQALVRGAATAFGTTVSVAAVDADVAKARAAIDEALAATQRIDALMSLHRDDSQLSCLNRDGVLDGADPHVLRNLQFAAQLAALSDGAFDVTVQPLWDAFARRAAEGALPSGAEIAAARRRVGAGAVALDGDRVRLRRGTAVTLNGIAQGYASDVATAILAAAGIRDALVDTGEFGAAGSNPHHQPWTLGLQHPRDARRMIATIRMDGRFLATSGDYATRFSADFRHHHVLDPRTGLSPPSFSSVAVAARSGMIADGLATALMVLDAEAGRRLLARYPGSDAVWIDKSMKLFATPGMPVVAT